MLSSIPDNRLIDCHILVVEDAYFIADDIAAALTGAGAVVVGPAPNGQVALSLLHSRRVDAAILDIDLHGASVYPVADALSARGTPYVFATGYGTTSIPAVYRSVQVWEKPFDSRVMIRILPDLIGRG